MSFPSFIGRRLISTRMMILLRTLLPSHLGPVGSLLRSLRQISLALASALLFLGLAPDSAEATPPAEPEKVWVGFYLNRLTAISQKDGTYSIDAWFWFRWKGDIDPTKTFELVNGRVDSVSPTEILDDNGFKYASIRVVATIFHVFDVQRYPLDDHKLTLAVEDSTNQAPLLKLLADEGSAMDPSVAIEGWKISFEGVSESEHSYPTTYGFRALGEDASKFSRLSFKLELRRAGKVVSLLKLFWVSFLALLLSVGACFVRANDLDARFGLGLGSIFAASANTIAVSAELPSTPILTLAEQINMVTVLTIFVTIFVSIRSLRYMYTGQEERASQLDMRCALFVSLLYALSLAVLLYTGGF